MVSKIDLVNLTITDQEGTTELEEIEYTPDWQERYYQHYGPGGVDSLDGYVEVRTAEGPRLYRKVEDHSGDGGLG